MSQIDLYKVASVGTPSANKGSIYFSSSKGALCFVDENGAQWWFGEQRVSLAADTSGYTSQTLADVAGILFPVRINTSYKFEFSVLWRTAATGTGLAVGVTLPSSPTDFAATVLVAGQGADGLTTSLFTGVLGASGESVVCPSGEATTVTYEALIRGTLVNGANAGNIQLQVATEVAASAITIKAGTSGRLWLP
jgi:hypothetical protein